MGCSMVHGRLLLPSFCMEPNPSPNDIRKTSRVPSPSQQAENLLPGVGARGQWAQGEGQHLGLGKKHCPRDHGMAANIPQRCRCCLAPRALSPVSVSWTYAASGSQWDMLRSHRQEARTENPLPGLQEIRCPCKGGNSTPREEPVLFTQVLQLLSSEVPGGLVTVNNQTPSESSLDIEPFLHRGSRLLRMSEPQMHL